MVNLLHLLLEIAIYAVAALVGGSLGFVLFQFTLAPRMAPGVQSQIHFVTKPTKLRKTA